MFEIDYEIFKEIAAFIRKTFNQPEGFIALHEPRFTGNEKKYLAECIDTTFVSSVGKFVDRFEEMIAAYTGVSKAVACVNGTNALHLALLLIGVEREDEVITQSLTFIAIANAISYRGAYPVFLDVDCETMGLSPAAVEEWLMKNAEMRGDQCYNKQTGRRIKACVPMHTFGHPVRLDELVALCHRYHIELVEDAAESLGSFYKERHTGTFGKVGALSFNGNKTITTGGGGMLLCNDLALAKHAKHLTTQAKLPHAWEFVHDHIGYNYRMPNINAALGCAQMERLKEIIENKRELAHLYAKFFHQIGVQIFIEPQNCRSNYWLNVLILKNKNERDVFLNLTNNEEVMTRPVWCPIHKLPMFATCQTDHLTNTQWFEERVVNIPSSARV
ncbi:MAG: LegC family aminotransferase [Candidatus Jettenia ecosi]|uniref:GDP-perosamine synthase n=1 Tax=Candidatus Jettenia ecosi TaxID=2494326 RepID=A0A533Q964_9BACT|nr:MAG: LegC family aminotransferase [Candidatus Jettenia ecosi]